MMKTTQFYLIIVCSIFIFSCKKVADYPYNTNKKEFCELLAKMYEDDQKYRLMIGDPMAEVLDSLRTAEGFDLTSYAKLPRKEQLAYGKIARAIADKRPKRFTKKQEDSLMQLQITLDNSNTEKLIKITQEFVWPLKNRIGCTEYFAPAIIFRHAQPQYHKEINEVIDKALSEGTMGKSEYTFILNHINKREDYEKTKIKVDNMKIEYQ